MARDGTKKRQLSPNVIPQGPPQAIAPPPSANLGFDPAGKTEPVDVVNAKDGWSEYTLADGTVMRAKAALLDVKRAVGQYDPNGDPVYVLQAAIVTQINAPDELKRKK